MLNDTTWNDVTKKKNDSTNAKNAGKLSLASLMPKEFQSIMAKATKRRRHSANTNDREPKSGFKNDITMRKSKISSGGTTTRPMQNITIKSIDDCKNSDKKLKTFETTISTHRIYMTPEEIANGSDNLSLQMCWLRPKLSISDNDIEKLILPPYKCSLGELFKFQKIPPSNNNTSSGNSNSNYLEKNGNLSVTVGGYIDSLDKHTTKMFKKNSSKKYVNKMVLSNENNNGNVMPDAGGDAEQTVSINYQILFDTDTQSFAMHQDLIKILQQWDVRQWGYVFSQAKERVESNNNEQVGVVSFDFHAMTIGQRRLFFPHILTSSLADHFISTPPNEICSASDFQELRGLINDVLPYSSYILSRNNISTTESNNKFLSKQQLINYIYNFNWWKLGSYGRQIEMDMTIYLLSGETK